MIFVLGGARSGKSRFALQRVESASRGRVFFIATARPSDPEFAARIRRHQAERPRSWITIEVDGDLVSALDHVERPDAILLDCLTLYLSQWLVNVSGVTSHQSPVTSDVEQKSKTHFEEIIRVLEQFDCPVIVVSNEVGEGIVPEYPLGRQFRDLMGQVNQQFAVASDEVYWLKAGLPLQLKARDVFVSQAKTVPTELAP